MESQPPNVDENESPYEVRDDSQSEPPIAIDGVDVGDLLKRALDDGAAHPSEEVITRGIQQKLRQESEGRFFSDTWSTSHSPRGVYLVTSLIMLAVLALLYVWLSPANIVLP